MAEATAQRVVPPALWMCLKKMGTCLRRALRTDSSLERRRRSTQSLVWAQPLEKQSLAFVPFGEVTKWAKSDPALWAPAARAPAGAMSPPSPSESSGRLQDSTPSMLW